MSYGRDGEEKEGNEPIFSFDLGAFLLPEKACRREGNRQREPQRSNGESGDGKVCREKEDEPER